MKAALAAGVVLAAFWGAGTGAAWAADAPKLVVIKAGRLIDVNAAAVRTDQVIVIEGEKIKAVGPAATTAIPAGAKLIDLSDKTVLPGLIDTHTHLTSDPTISYLDSYHLSSPRIGLLGAAGAWRTLRAGVTTARNVGAGFYADVALRGSIEAGDLPGPRVFAAGPMISMTGGHGDDNHLAPHYQHSEEGVADGVDAVRKAVRAHVKYGVDLIKIATTGGVFSSNTRPETTHFSLEEAKTIVAEAHNLVKTVAVHAHGPGGIKMAIRAGADSVEHASLIDDEGIALAKQA
jgi:imidazolonepropionase-like amidohydrolase